MIPTISVDYSKFRDGARALLVAKNQTVEQLVTDQGRLLTRDLLRMTPPFGGHPITESWNAQRRIGEAEVARDVGRVFRPISTFSILAHPKNLPLAMALQRLVQSKDLAGIQTLLERLGFQIKVVNQPDAGLHKAARRGRGRVPKSHRPVLVLDERALKRFVSQLVGDVGKTKSGWLAAADALGVKGVPNWIRRHAGQVQGSVRIEKQPGSFSITIGNLVGWSSDFSHLSIVQSALTHRARAMQLQAEAILQRAFKKVL